MVTDKKPTIDELKAIMDAKIKAIPTISLSNKKVLENKDKNRQQDRQVLEHTKQILSDRRKEAEECGDSKKKFHSIAIEKTQTDQYNVRERIRELDLQFKTARASFSDPDWQILSTFSDLKDPHYWDQARLNGFTDNDVGLYYKDVFGIEPKMIVKFISLMKIKKEMDELQKKCT